MPGNDPTYIREVESDQPDDETLLGGDERRSLANERQRAKIADLEQDREQRKAYAGRIYRLVVGWLLGVGAIVLLQGFSVHSFSLPTVALTTLIGSTTLSVIGIFAIVANYLFPRGGSGARDGV